MVVVLFSMSTGSRQLQNASVEVDEMRSDWVEGCQCVIIVCDLLEKVDIICSAH